jgi:hypothetical protein
VNLFDQEAPAPAAGALPLPADLPLDGAAWHTGRWWSAADGPPHAWQHAGRYTHLIRAPGDPDRSPRPEKGTGGRADKRADKTLARSKSVAQLERDLVGHFAAHPATTFHHAAVTLWDLESTLAPSRCEDALWLLVAAHRLEHTAEAPIRFRLRNQHEGETHAEDPPLPVPPGDRHALDGAAPPAGGEPRGDHPALPPAQEPPADDARGGTLFGLPVPHPARNPQAPPPSERLARLRRQLDDALALEARLSAIGRAGCLADQENLRIVHQGRQRIEAQIAALEAPPARWGDSLPLFS